MPFEIVPLAFFAMIASIAIGRPMARAWSRRLEAQASGALAPDAQARLERMEQAIESIAVEVERIAEGQRFTTRLLAERAAAAAPLASGDRQREERHHAH